MTAKNVSSMWYKTGLYEVHKCSLNVFQGKGISLEKLLNHSSTKSKLKKKFFLTMFVSVKYFFSGHILKGPKE